jgi:hypothetical protein
VVVLVNRLCFLHTHADTTHTSSDCAGLNFCRALCASNHSHRSTSNGPPQIRCGTFCNTLMFKVRVPNVPLVPRQSREDGPQAPRRVGRGVGPVTAGRSGGPRRALVWATAFYKYLVYKYLANLPHPREPRRRDERATYDVVRKAREDYGALRHRLEDAHAAVEAAAIAARRRVHLNEGRER